MISEADIRRLAIVGDKDVGAAFRRDLYRNLPLIGKGTLEDPRIAQEHDFIRRVLEWRS